MINILLHKYAHKMYLETMYSIRQFPYLKVHYLSCRLSAVCRRTSRRPVNYSGSRRNPHSPRHSGSTIANGAPFHGHHRSGWVWGPRMTPAAKEHGGKPAERKLSPSTAHDDSLQKQTAHHSIKRTNIIWSQKWLGKKGKINPANQYITTQFNPCNQNLNKKSTCQKQKFRNCY